MGRTTKFLRPNATFRLLIRGGGRKVCVYSGDRIEAVTRILHRISPGPWLLTFTALARHKLCGRLSKLVSSRAAASIRHNPQVTGSRRSPESCTGFLPAPWLLTFTALARHKVCGRLSKLVSSRAAASFRHNPKRGLMKAIVRISTLVLLLLTVVTASAQSFIAPSDSLPGGKSYEQWAAKWWQWAESIPLPNNPDLGYQRRRTVPSANTGDVWFLAGTDGFDATRSCTIPKNKMIFFPIINCHKRLSLSRAWLPAGSRTSPGAVS